MLIGKPADGRSFWKAEKTDKGTLYTLSLIHISAVI